MDEQAFLKVGAVAAAILVMTAAPAWIWGPGAVTGVLAGGVWNLASLWCLVHLLNAWIRPHPSKRRVLGWLLLKSLLLALLIFGILRAPRFSLIGFGVGFTVVLLVVLGYFALRTQRMVVSRSHGR